MCTKSKYCISCWSAKYYYDEFDEAIPPYPHRHALIEIENGNFKNWLKELEIESKLIFDLNNSEGEE